MSRETDALAAYMRALTAMRDALPHMLDHEDDTNGGPWWQWNAKRRLEQAIFGMEAGLKHRGLCRECGAAPEFCHCGHDRCDAEAAQERADDGAHGL